MITRWGRRLRGVPAIGASLFVIAVFAVLLTTSLLHSPRVQAAQTIPYKVNFQGRLTDATGNIKPDGLYNMKIRIYSAASGGTLLGTEVRDGSYRVQVTNGLFSIQIGDNTALAPSLFTNYPLYIEVELPTPATATCATVGCGTWTEGPMSPRSALGSSPYAFNSDTVDGIDGINIAQTNAANTFSSTNYFTNSLTMAQYSPLLFNMNAGSYSIQDAGAGGYFLMEPAGLNLGVTVSGASASTPTMQDAIQLRAAASNVVSAVDTGVTYPDNLVSNASFEFGCSAWIGCTTTSTAAPSSGLSSSRFVQSSPTSTQDINSRFIAAQPGDQFYTSVKVKTSATNTGQGGLCLRFLDASGNTLSWSNGDWTNPGTSYITKSWVHTAPASTAYVTLCLTIRGNGVAGGTWDFDDAYVYKVNKSMPVTYKNDINGTTAFQVQDASGANLFVADTTNNAIKIGGGDVSPNATPTLLVLDHKSTSGDPTGTNGGMYYNASSGKFRCYEASLWKDCISSGPGRNLFQYATDFMSVNYLATNEPDITWDGSIASFTQGTTLAGRPGVGSININGSSSARMSLSANTDTFDNLFLGNGATWTASAGFMMPTLSDGSVRYTLRFGFIDSVSAESTDGCFLRYVDNVNSGAWQGVCRNNNSESVCNTAATPVANTWYDVKVGVNSAGTLATFVVNDTLSCTVNSNIPTGAGRATSYGVYAQKNLATTARSINIDYMDIRGDNLAR